MSQPLTDREIMEQALEALEEINKLSIGENAICLPAEIDGALDALRERLAQPEQEPVGHTLNCVCGAVWDVSPDGVEEMVHAPNPPQRKPLTDEEIEVLAKKHNGIYYDCDITFARAIEAAHGIKGGV